jgi:hypothetical protein
MGWTALAVLGITTAATVHGGTLWVAFPAQAESCSYAQVSNALHARLGDVDVRPGVHDVAGSDVSVALERDGSDWELRVRAVGEPELRRKLPKAGTDCVELTETSSLMIERYLDEIRWTGGRAVMQKLPPEPPKPPSPPWQIVLEVGGGAAAGALGLAPAGTLDVGARKGPWQLLLSGEVQGQKKTALSVGVPGGVPATGTLTLQAAAVQVSAGYFVATGFGELTLEVTPGAELFWSSTQGDNLPHHHSANTTVPFLGLRVGYDFPVWRRLFLSLRLEARAHANIAFVVTGAPNFTVSTGNFDGYASLAVGYVFL